MQYYRTILSSTIQKSSPTAPPARINVSSNLIPQVEFPKKGNCHKITPIRTHSGKIAAENHP
jgi:hypothetical protein